jgi:hypothetical protein
MINNVVWNKKFPFFPFYLYTFLETKRLYADICNGDYYCNETLNFICPTVPGRKKLYLIYSIIYSIKEHVIVQLGAMITHVIVDQIGFMMD